MHKESDNEFLSVSDCTSIPYDQMIVDEGHCSSSNNDNTHGRSSNMTDQSTNNLSNLDNYYQGLFGQQEQDTVSDGDIPNGKYTVLVIDTKMETTTNGFLQLVWELKITEGEYKDRVIEHRNTIVESIKAMQQLKRDISFFSDSMKGLGDLHQPELHNVFKGKRLKVAVDQQEISYNTYFLKVLK
jgi:RNA processing factor Prp31